MTASDPRRIENRWYVITGGPCSGKTTIVNELKKRGYATAIEDARHYIDLQRANGKTVEEVQKNQRKFQRKVLNMQIAQERSLSRDKTVFLDRAIPDARAYYRFLNLPEDKKLNEAFKTLFYRKIFILDPLPLVKDYARREDEKAQKTIHKLLTEVYGSLPFPIVHVPVLPVEQRVEFILNNL